MKKIWKRILAILMVIFLIAGAAPIGVLAELNWPTLPNEAVSSWWGDSVNAVRSAVTLLGDKLHGLSIQASAATYSGSCGENVYWSLNTGTGALTISGSGKMDDYSWTGTPNPSPWRSYRSSIKTVTISNGVTSIGDSAFGSCSNLTSITIPDSVTSIGKSTFLGCDSLTSVTIPDSVTAIGQQAFDECTNLSSVKISNSLTTISDQAFSACKKLTKITSPDSVTSIGVGAFLGCDSLTSVTIPKNVTSIDWSAFGCCKSLSAITVDGKNPAYCSDTNGVLYNKSKTELLQYPNGNPRTSFTIPNSVTSIEISAFEECTKLTQVTIPNSVKSIGAFAFRGCTRLTSVTIGNSVMTIGSLAFQDCTSLSNVTIPDSVTKIENEAFNGCTRLASLTIGSGVKSIYSSAFSGCSSLKDVYYAGSKAQWDAIIIRDGNNSLLNATIHYSSSVSDEALEVLSSYPTNGEKYMPLDKDITLTFNYPVSVLFGEDSICIKEFETDRVVSKATINCVSVNENTITLKHMVHNPIVDSNEVIKEGGKLKGNMTYYLYVPENTIKAKNSNHYFVCTNKNTFVFSTYISKNRTSLEFKQEHTIQDTSYYSNIQKKYKGSIGYYAAPLNNFIVPGLKNNMIPQGLTYYHRKSGNDWILISSYHKVKDKDKETSNHHSSVIFALDATKGNLVAQFNLHTAYGKISRIHAGGIAVSDNNLYLTYYGSQIAYIPLSELDVPNGTTKDVCIRSTKDLGDYNNNTNAAYMNYSQGVLWTGNFYCSKTEDIIVNHDLTNWSVPASKKHNSIILGYKLSGYADSISEWNALGSIIKQSHYTYQINLPNRIDGFQGATVKDGTLYLSRAEWRPWSHSLNSAILMCKIQLRENKESTVKENTPFMVIYNLAGGENIFFGPDGKLYCVYEAEGLKNYGKLSWKMSKSSDVLWKFDESNIAEQTTVYFLDCPVDVEIYEKDTGDLVGKIQNNVVDSDVLLKDNAVYLSVFEDSKTFYLPRNNNYTVKLIGNDSGKMDYSVSTIDDNLNVCERINFFDKNLEKNITYIGNYSKSSSNLSNYVLSLNNQIIPPDNYERDGQISTIQINVSPNDAEQICGGGEYLLGDRVILKAYPDNNSVFLGWYENGSLIERDSSLSFVAKKNRNLVAKFQSAMSAAQLNFRSSSTVDYRSKVTVVASASYVPSGYYVALYDGSTQLAKGDNKTVSCALGEMRTSKTLTAKIVDASGKVQKDSQSNDLTANIEIRVSAGFVKRLIAFFKGIFGLLPNVVIQPEVDAIETVYTLSYDANGGSGAPGTQTGFGTVTIPSTEPTRDGYTFLGWGLTATTSNVQYQPGTTITLVSNTVLYAVWKQDNFILTYHANGGENEPGNQMGNGIITLSTQTPTREGYVFTGWATSSSASSSQYSAGSSYSLSQNTTLYAVWVIKGDINMDGEINLVDLTRLKYYLAGTIELTEIQKSIADLNNDGYINDADLTLMRQLLVGLTP
ncbi:MAG: leucine-rich repeat protein [Clostridia bacterium]|nr:leucine-rich repeat protein [Clostridia bacterium]